MRPLAVLGNVNVDLIMGPTDAWPRPGTELVVAHDDLRPGGGVAYAGLAWTALGAPHVVAANVGDDAYSIFNEALGTLVVAKQGEATIIVQVLTADTADQLRQATELAEAVIANL